VDLDMKKIKLNTIFLVLGTLVTSTSFSTNTLGLNSLVKVELLTPNSINLQIADGNQDRGIGTGNLASGDQDRGTETGYLVGHSDDRGTGTGRLV